MSPRKAPRLKEFDYLGRLRSFDDRTLAEDTIAQLFRSASAFHFAVIAYCAMPDHVHVLVRGERDDSALKLFVHSWKTTTGFRWRRSHPDPLWQSSYYDHVLRDETAELGVARYILLNPVRAGLVAKAEDYSLCGSGQYTIRQILEAAGDWKPTW